MADKEKEQRRHPRVDKTFVVSYRVCNDIDNYDLTQTKNISAGGMLLTTNQQFNTGVLLSINIRLPFLMKPINLKGRVVRSKQVVKNLIYDTSIELIEIDRDAKEVINKIYNR